MSTEGSVTALVLCGGLGTRLRSVLADRPKILAPIAGKPFAHYLLGYLRGQGVERIVLCTGHGADQVEAYCGDGSAWGVRLAYSREQSPLGTGGAVKLAEPHIESDPFIVINGDSFLKLDVRRMLELHRLRSARISMALVNVPDRARFGAVELDGSGAISAFGEKGHAGPGPINAGVYVIDRSVLASIASGVSVSIEREVFPQFAGAGLYGVEVPGNFVDIGTPESYAEAEAVVLGIGS
ncbi:MAG: nucleotidyltransferase family protein [Polyangiales bacterium]